MGMREGSDPLALSHGDCNSWLLLLSFLRTNSQPGMREGSDPLALSHGATIRGSLLLLFLPTNSLPRMREGSDPLAFSRGTGIRGSCFFRFFARTRRRGSERVSTLSRSPMGTAIRGSLLLLFLPTNSPPRMREGCDPLALSRGGRDSRLSTSFTSPFVSPYSSGMRTVSDWGGTVTAVDSFFGCAESRFAERKSVWVTASGSVTRISRSAERLYTR